MPQRPKVHKAYGSGVKAARKMQDARRGTAAQRGYTYKWQKARASYLKENPLCSHCYAAGLAIEATVVDHVKPHRGDDALFWDVDNWQALCKPCHDRKTGQGL